MTMQLTIRRRPTANGITLGVFLMDGNAFGYSLEGETNPMNMGDQAIPLGSYAVAFTTRGLCLLNVPKRGAIPIIADGSQAGQRGGILVGYRAGSDTVIQCQPAHKALCQSIREALDAGEKVHLEITDAQEDS